MYWYVGVCVKLCSSTVSWLNRENVLLVKNLLQQKPQKLNASKHMSLLRQSARKVFSASSIRARYINATPSTRAFHTCTSFFASEEKPQLQRKVESAQKPEVTFDEPTPVRLHDVTPNPLPKSLAPTHEEDYENNWLTMPTLFERAVGSERAELLNPNIYDELLVRNDTNSFLFPTPIHMERTKRAVC